MHMLLRTTFDVLSNTIVIHGQHNTNTPGRMVFHKRWKASAVDATGHQFRRALGIFVEQVVAPLLYNGGPGDADGGGGGGGEAGVGEVVYQRNPTLRVQMPGYEALGAKQVKAHHEGAVKALPSHSTTLQPFDRRCSLKCQHAPESIELPLARRPSPRHHAPPPPRAYMAHMAHMIYAPTRHNDYKYKRQPTEINVWIPLTWVGPGNTLWVIILLVYVYNLDLHSFTVRIPGLHAPQNRTGTLHAPSMLT